MVDVEKRMMEDGRRKVVLYLGKLAPLAAAYTCVTVLPMTM